MARASKPVRSTSNPGGGLGLWLGVAVVVLLLDQVAKVAVRQRLAYGQRLNVTTDFDLTLLFNKGAAFSFLNSAAGWQRWMFIGIGIAAALFIVGLLKRHGGQRLFSLALALILGGALGNVLDRVVHGQVTDFLLFYWHEHYFPAFNIADAGISVGAALLVLDELLRVRRAS